MAIEFGSDGRERDAGILDRKHGNGQATECGEAVASNDDGGGATRDGLPDEVMAIDVEARDGDEEAAGLDTTRVVGDAIDADASSVVMGCDMDCGGEMG